MNRLRLALLACLAAALYWFSRPTPASTASESPPASPAVQLHAAPPTAGATAPNRVPAPSIRRILPDLAERPADWRTYQPEKIVFAAYPDTPLEFTATSIKQEHGRTVWVGRNAVEGALLITVATADTWTAEMTLPGANIFSAEISGDTATMIETSDTVARCAAEFRPVPAAPVVAATESDGNTTSVIGPVAAATDVNTVDLVIFYHPQLLNPTGTNASTYRTATAIENQSILHVTYLNQAVLNSQIDNIQWRTVALYETPDYPHSFEGDPDQGSTLQNDLSQMNNSSTVLGQFVLQKMVQHGADQAVLYVPFATNRSSPFTAGVANQPGRNAVVSLSAGVSSIFAHECAHNVGCGHDRTEAEAPDNNNRFNYGYIDGTLFRTIMAYGSNPRIPHFSNPDVNHNGRPTGLPSTDPKAADNARRIRETAVSFAAFRSPPVAAPTLTTQPASTTVTTGSAFSLSVTATGEALTYQWRHDNVALTGANLATYTKTAVATDAGAYTVTVSNNGGQVTSNAATVTVTAPAPPPPPAPSSSSSGGGGGGAPSLYFLAALLIAAAIRKSWHA